MAKPKKVFVCNQCGASHAKWSGKCSACGSWNTMTEEIVNEGAPTSLEKYDKSPSTRTAPVELSDIEMGEMKRVPTSDREFDRVLGGGLVPGSVVLIGGEPGIGKSTLLLKIAFSAKFDKKALYVSGEESAEQIKMRANRMGLGENEGWILPETRLDNVLKVANKVKPGIVIIDSVQTITSSYLDSAAGTISQVRECAATLQQYAKSKGIPVILVGHITKEGTIAGPKVLEHIVDTVLNFEGDRNYMYRILRTQKNRFGSTDELGIYEMNATGLEAVENPSRFMLRQSEDELSGSTISAAIEGIRPLLIETQALVSPAIYGNPQRSPTGFDLRRLSMLLAVLEKKGGHQFGTKDVFLNLAGGIKIMDPAMDLSVAAALLSSLEDIPVPENICFCGEIGLSGEIRAVGRIEQRIQEAARLGFKYMYYSKYNNLKAIKKEIELELIPLGKVDELYSSLFV
ncbi:MAG: DNA repair protein RadA [Saprospirales bacterium]|nr:MAG: DNA repair protein RadA [Saprospirales bacterium]